MGYITAFKYDIFISYTHKDNVIIAKNDPWVNVFHESLENWLRNRRGISNLEVWRDKNLDGNTLFNEEIKQTINNSALFLALNSPNYLASKYCQQELAWFHQFNKENQRSLQVGNELRILNVLLRNIPHEEWSEALGRTSGFPMHDAADEDNLGEFTDPGDPNFIKQLRKIVDAIEKTLKHFPQESSEPESVEQKKSPIHIFFADVADTLKTYRKRLIADAENAGAIVCGNAPPPWDATQHEAKVEEQLKGATFSVHLLDEWPGREITENNDMTFPRKQTELALKNKKSQLIWVPKNLDINKIEDENQRNLINELENGNREASRFEFVRGQKSTLTELVLQKIKQGIRTSGNGNGTLSFLVDTHQKDQGYAFKLAAFLAEKNIQVKFNQESGEPLQSLSNFESAVKHVKNLILMYGKVGPIWLNGRIKKTIKIVAEQFGDDAFALENIWIYLVPGSDTRVSLPNVPRLFNIEILDNSNSEKIEPNVIRRLLEGGRG